MGSGMPEIGSRINLISKADIRYEGKLFAVDPEECTIALSSVRSYGTEDRKTTYPVPAQHHVYDFILFRGSDIKDIRVLTTTIPNDPAIVQLSVPPSLSGALNKFESVESDFQSVESDFLSAASGSRMPNVPSLSTKLTQTFQSSGLKSTSAFGNLDQITNKNPLQKAASEEGSRSSTPSTHKISDGPARTSFSPTKSDDQSQPQRQRKQQAYGNRDMNRSHQQQQQYNQNNRHQQGNRLQYQQRYQQSRYPQQQQHQQYQQQHQQQYQQQSQYRNYNNRENQYQKYNYNDYNRERYGQRQYMQPLQGNGQRSDNWNNYGGQRRMNRPLGSQVGAAGNQQNGYQSAGGYQNQNNRKPRNTIKFEDDYDFEQANSKFEEMRSQLAKTKISDADASKLNGDVEEAKKEDSSNEVSAGEENENDAESKEICYDKVKSFFDQISYEAIERSKGLSTRIDWKTERKINSETFGQVALRRNINYRGRVNGHAAGYYNNYNNNRNSGMQNNYRSGGYNNRSQGNQRRHYNNPINNPVESKENQVAT